MHVCEHVCSIVDCVVFTEDVQVCANGMLGPAIYSASQGEQLMYMYICVHMFAT